MDPDNSEISEPIKNGIVILATYLTNKFYIATYNSADQEFKRPKHIYKSITDAYRNILSLYKDLFLNTTTSLKTYKDYVNGIVAEFMKYSNHTYSIASYSGQLEFICSIFIPSDYVHGQKHSDFIKEIMKIVTLPCAYIAQQNLNLIIDNRDDHEISKANMQELTEKFTETIYRERHKMYLKFMMGEQKVLSPNANINDELARKVVEYLKEITALKTENTNLKKLIQMRIPELTNAKSTLESKLQQVEIQKQQSATGLEAANRKISELNEKIRGLEYDLQKAKSSAHATQTYSQPQSHQPQSQPHVVPYPDYSIPVPESPNTHFIDDIDDLTEQIKEPVIVSNNQDDVAFSLDDALI